VHASFSSAGAEPTAMSEAARRQATASLLSDTSRRCQAWLRVAIGQPAYLRVRGGLWRHEQMALPYERLIGQR
jgi:hypothetical protein